MDRLKLQWKIFAFLLGFCTLLLVVLWLFQTVFLDDMYKQVRRGEVNSAIALVEKHIDSDDLGEIVLSLERDREIKVLSAVDSPPPVRESIPDKGKDKFESLSVQKTFFKADGTSVHLVFQAIISPVNATVSTLQMQLVIITGVMILLSVVLALVLARRVAKPIVAIGEGASQLAAGNYDTRFDGHGFLEICQLSDTLNTTASELAKVEGLRRELMANISHDLRTPLTLIYSYAEMMHDFPEDITPAQSKVIMDESTRLSSLVSDILSLSKLEAGVSDFNPHLYNLSDSIHQTVSRLGELVREQGFDLHFDFEHDVFVCADEDKITRAVYNLLLNAITYSGQKRRVDITQQVQGTRVRISVRDYGEGISPDLLPHIWERYYRGVNSHRRDLVGSGLGLSIVKKIVQLHGGTCGVDADDTGSTFWFEIETVKKDRG